MIAIENDFNSNPITFDILPGDTSAIVSIRIINNGRVERDENFDVVLQSNSSGVVIGSPKQATVTIINDDSMFCTQITTAIYRHVMTL